MTDCKLEVFRGRLRRWHWRFICRGHVICTSNHYSNSTNAMTGAKNAVRNFASFDVDNITKIRPNEF